MAFGRKKKKLNVAIAFPEANSVGLAMIESAGPVENAFDAIGNDHTVILLENDLYRRTSKEKTDTFFKKAGKVIVLDHILNTTCSEADVLLPAASYAESSGTLINNEGRAQRYYPVLPKDNRIKESWEWIADIIGLNNPVPWEKFDEVVAACSRTIPAFSGIITHLPNEGYRLYNEKIARQTMRFSGRTSMNADVMVSEPKPPQDKDAPLNFSMEGYKGHPPADLIPYYWSPGWNSPQAVNKYLNEPNGKVKNSDPGYIIFEPAKYSLTAYSNSIPEKFTQGEAGWLIVPVHRIFGSEELSAKGEAVNERSDKPFVLLNEAEIKRNKIEPTMNYHLQLENTSVRVKVVIDSKVPDRIMGLSCLLPGMPFIDLPATGKATFSLVTEK